MRFLLRLLLNGIAIIVAAWFIPGVHLAGIVPALIAGALLGFVNALVRPILLLLTLPFTLITLGLFIFVVNAICFALTAALVPGFEINGFLSAFFGAILVSLVSWVLNALLGDDTERRDWAAAHFAPAVRAAPASLRAVGAACSRRTRGRGRVLPSHTR
jgi:putative membrane protein